MNNYFLILDLPFDPMEDNEIIIKEKIEEKERFWISNFNDFYHGKEYRKYYQKIDDIKNVMLDSSLRKKEAEKAKILVYKKVYEYFQMLVSQQCLTNEEIDWISKKTGIDRSIILNEMKKYGYLLKQEDGKKSISYYKKYYEDKPASTDTFLYLEETLALFQVRDLYEFLGCVYNEQGKYTISTEDLRNRAKKLEQEKFYKFDSESTQGKKLCAACELAFKDDESRIKYGQYREWIKVKRILEQIKEIAVIKEKRFSKEQYYLFQQKLYRVLPKKEEADKVFASFCMEESIFFKIEENSSIEQSQENTGSYENKKMEQIFIENVICYMENNFITSRQLDKSVGINMIISIKVEVHNNDVNARYGYSIYDDKTEKLITSSESSSLLKVGKNTIDIVKDISEMSTGYYRITVWVNGAEKKKTYFFELYDSRDKQNVSVIENNIHFSRWIWLNLAINIIFELEQFYGLICSIPLLGIGFAGMAGTNLILKKEEKINFYYHLAIAIFILSIMIEIIFLLGLLSY